MARLAGFFTSTVGADRQERPGAAGLDDGLGELVEPVEQPADGVRGRAATASRNGPEAAASSEKGLLDARGELLGLAGERAGPGEQPVERSPRLPLIVREVVRELPRMPTMSGVDVGELVGDGGEQPEVLHHRRPQRLQGGQVGAGDVRRLAELLALALQRLVATAVSAR